MRSITQREETDVAVIADTINESGEITAVLTDVR